MTLFSLTAADAPLPLSAWLAVYAATALTVLALDGVWLGVLARPFYAASMGHLLAPQPLLAATVLFYVLYPMGLVLLGVMPHGGRTGVTAAALSGALLGLLAYGTYDLTNLATLRDWPLRLSLVDTAWGCLLSGLACAVGKRVLDLWLPARLAS
jgi:uncharacterized membrane protein